MWEKIKSKYIAPISFYQRVGRIAVPIALQQILNQAASFVDTIMVSQIGAVGAVAVASQLDILLMNVGFGINSGAQMYASQFYGAHDQKSLKKIFGFQLSLNLLNALVFFLIACFFGRNVLAFYSSGDVSMVAVGWQYMKIACLAYVATALTNTYSFMYRSIQQTQIPMYIGILVTSTNAFLNYCLIFGKFGMSQLGVAGAALATVIATSGGALIHIIYAIKTKQPFIGRLDEIFGFDRHFIQPIFKRMIPLIVNETLFGFGNSMYIKAYGLLGKTSLEIYKIGDTVSKIFYVCVQGLNSATGLVVGEQLGKKNLDMARKYGGYLVSCAVILALTFTTLIIVFSKPMVSLFGLTDPTVYAGAVMIVRLFSIRIATRLFNVIIMSSLRAGGDSLFLMFLDCGIMWLVGIPLAFASVYLFKVTSISLLFAIIQIEQITRLFVGFHRYQQGKWVRNLTSETTR